MLRNGGGAAHHPRDLSRNRRNVSLLMARKRRVEKTVSCLDMLSTDDPFHPMDLNRISCRPLIQYAAFYQEGVGQGHLRAYSGQLAELSQISGIACVSFH